MPSVLTFWQLLCKAKEIYDYYEYIESKFIDRISLVMQNISKKELKSALTTLADAEVSNCKEREISSAITQLRLALEKTNEDIVAAKIAALTALCYSILSEVPLARKYEEKSVHYFESHCDKKLTEMKISSRLPVCSINIYVKQASIMHAVSVYNQLVADAKDFGLSIRHEEIDILGEVLIGFSVGVVPLISPLIGESLSTLVDDAKIQYTINLQTILWG